jgi:hypothetical protein
MISYEDNSSEESNEPTELLNNSDDDIIIISSSEDSEDSDYESELDSDNEYDDINREDYAHLYAEKSHGKYYIGACDKVYSENFILMASTVSPTVYFKYPHRTIIHYLYYYSGNYCGLSPKKISLDIMKLDILEDGTYNVIIKTFWIKIIQRLWRKCFRKRKEVLKKRKEPYSLKYREYNGKWPNSIVHTPSLYGLISNNIFVKCHY